MRELRDRVLGEVRKVVLVLVACIIVAQQSDDRQAVRIDRLRLVPVEAVAT